MKKYIIGFIFGSIIFGSIGVLASSLLASDIEYKPNWKKSNGEDITNVAEAIEELYSKSSNSTSYLSIDKIYLNSGSYPESVQITDNNLNSSDGISITGTGRDKKWEKEIDFTNYTILSFYAKKGADHGKIQVNVDNNTLLEISYDTIDNVWERYLIDVSEFVGVHTLKFYGGWGDSTGSPSSNTQYCDIRLYNVDFN